MNRANGDDSSVSGRRVNDAVGRDPQLENAIEVIMAQLGDELAAALIVTLRAMP